MRWVRSPVWIRVVRSDYLYSSAWFRYAMKFGDKAHHIGNVLDHVTADYFIELIFSERVRDPTEIVNHISVCSGVGVDADCARIFVLTATNVKNLFRQVNSVP